MESNWIEAGGRVYCLRYPGPPDATPFVLVHGLGGSHANWLPIVPGLARHGTVYAIDLAGFGRTPPEGRSASVEANVALLNRVLAVLGRPVVLIGNSMGGAISILQAAAHPDSVAGLVLVDPALPPRYSHVFDRAGAQFLAAFAIPAAGIPMAQRRLRKVGPERVAMKGLKMCTVDYRRVDPAVVAEQIAIMRERMDQPWTTPAFLEASRSLVRLLARRREFLRTVRAVVAPTLMLMGRQDRLVPLAAAEAVARVRADWDFVVFDDVGHVPQLEAPRHTLAAIERWLGTSQIR
ncbi:MAG: alpha/beta hydrolase [Actinomycetota bacterium]